VLLQRQKNLFLSIIEQNKGSRKKRLTTGAILDALSIVL
jgi:hypothetical protein